MENYIFGYGSLSDLGSAARTLGRSISGHEVLIVQVQSYSRIWRLVIPVRVNGYPEPINAVFLDIQKDPDKKVNGIIIEVTEAELNKLDIREKHYNRIDITEYVRPHVQEGLVYAYQGKPEFFVENFTNPKVLTEYMNILYKGFKHWGSEFCEDFEATTQPHNFETIDGSYEFCDRELNILTGRE